MTWTSLQKLKCIERELEFRRHIYPDRVRVGTMTQREMDRQISIMEAIAEDYRAEVARNEPTLLI